MPDITGRLRKMASRASSPVEYQLRLDEHQIELNPLLERSLSITHSGRILCINCDRVTRSSFSQGYCYPCFRKLPETDTCIMSPEKCHYTEGTCRDPEWGEKHCMQPHTVYLSNTSGAKIGITRNSQIPVRWVDQGAKAAMPIAHVSTRQLAGFVEDRLRQYVSDRTQWQRMLKSEAPDIDMRLAWQELKQQAAAEISDLDTQHGDAIQWCNETDETPLLLNYPVLENPEKVKSLSLDKTPEITGRLQGIKGQYLILDSGVMNVRKFTGYEVTFSYPDN